LDGVDDCLFFHHDDVGHHWLLFIGNPTTKNIFCVDPTDKHSENSIDVQGVHVITSYFGNFTPSGPLKPEAVCQSLGWNLASILTASQPQRRINKKYDARPAKVQRDSTSYGFWVKTLALLWACGVSITRKNPKKDDNMQILRNLGINRVKSYWKAI
jgi:hypothetical protein